MASLMDHNEAMSPKGLLRQKVEETRDFDEHIKPFLDLFARTMLRFRSGERITEEDLDALDAYKVHLLHDHIRVRLDVGGQIFATSKSTLTSVKGTFFDAMFSGECIALCCLRMSLSLQWCCASISCSNTVLVAFMVSRALGADA